MDEKVVRVPGDVGHKDTYPFPVIFSVVKGVKVRDLVSPPTPTIREKSLLSALKLARKGVRVIATSCGLAVLLQNTLSTSLDVPVITSGLLALPLLKSIFSAPGSIGVITADSRLLKPWHLEAAGVSANDIVVK